MLNFRFDFVFSYWIFAWFLLYKMHLVSFNPFFALVFGLINNLLFLCFAIFYNYNHFDIFAFFVIMICIKVIPLCCFSKSEMVLKSKDYFFTLFLFLLYLFWLKINAKKISSSMFKMFKNPKKGKSIDTPMINVLKTISINLNKF